MVGCSMLNDISHALSVAKGNALAFGGVNVIFAGDFAQLPPVRQVRLYTQITNQQIANAATTYGQKVVFGKLLWLSVTTVVLLHENMRQRGEENRPFVELLGRLRDDVDWQSERWSNAPIIVVENAMKDALNLEMVKDFSARTGQPIYWYHARD
ncbi:hypothetical protein C8R43DRAFT_868071, partial [Mycena crocata]